MRVVKHWNRVAQRGGGGPISGNIQDQVGQGSEQPDLVSGVPARWGGVGLDGVPLGVPSDPKLSMIL